ncbi:hypothetical protein BJ969_003129 [Saccharopolyspora gloriosae]|uniref:Uncharacterized protein n=1 Tax=Saccharopolyspora gloriosae TaxID=455344 RepID=A0A840NGA7_9PSEU|nr:hypothetical protein [Saccharopolyspora gloriosae]MBB5070041.1 hypothetical protein [Saccharopolyspora gloriosae]
MHRQAVQRPKPVHEDALLQIWLTGRVSDLLELASSDLEQALEQACQKFDELVSRWGAERVGRALDALFQDFQR